jgi:ABC-2 type transport system permease protein
MRSCKGRGRMISAYLDFIRIRFLMMLAYRVNYYSGIAIYAINIGAYYFLWKAIYGANESLGGLTVTQMTTYVAVSWMARAFYFNNLDREIANEIRDGSVAIQFIRPYKYLIVKIMQGLGEGIFRLLLFSVPGMAVVYLIFPIVMPKDPWIWLVFMTMIFFSFLINSQINILTGLFAFFVENNEGMMRMKRVAVDLFSGLIIPISFFPGWAETLLKLLPFQAITYLPGSVFTGKVGGDAVYGVLGVQVFWVVFLSLPIWWIWRRARTRLFVQGG